MLALIVSSVQTHAGMRQEGRELTELVLREASEPSGDLEEPWPWLEPVALDLLGRRDEAIAALRRRVAEGADSAMYMLDADAFMTGLATDPRYEASIAPARAKAAEQVRLAEQAGLL